MKTDDILLSAPKDFLRYSSVLLSAPADIRRFESAVQPATEFRPLQCLFGHDAQLQLFASALRHGGLEPWLLAAPDIYASHFSFSKLFKTVGIDSKTSHKILHLSFGAPSRVRVLREAANFAVLAGLTSQSPCHFYQHPFGSDRHLPAAFTGVLTYYPLQSTICSSDERELPTYVLDAAFSADPIADQGSSDVLDHVYNSRMNSDFCIQSVGEFTVSSWENKSWSVPLQSLDFRRAYIRRNVVMPGKGGPLRFILLPWNLANPRSMVPDLAEKFASEFEPGELENGIILLPFNENDTSASLVQALVDVCRTRGATSCKDAIFLMRVVSLRSIPALREIVTNCWIDGTDPDWRWNAKRLSKMGFNCLLLSEPESMTFASDSQFRPEVDKVFPAEDSCTIRATGKFGERVWTSHTVSARVMRRLLRYDGRNGRSARAR